MATRTVGLAFVLVAAGLVASAQAVPEESDWRDDWGTAEGFALTEDSAGFLLPTAIAFVPQPGEGPGDIAYFVAELRGDIKAVSIDRTVETWATVPAFQVESEFPSPGAEGGLGAICLSPDEGFLFATYTFHDAEGVLRNGLARFDSTPQTFAGEPEASRDLSGALAGPVSALSHQVGGCRSSQGALFVAVGDGAQPKAARDPSVPLGKVLRLTLDGEPHPENPFGGGAAASSWAVGLRNPFAIEVVEDRVFVADNGVDVDRFLDLSPGGDYLWSGDDESIRSSADAIFDPSLGPAHMAYVDASAPGWADGYGSGFVISATAERSGLSGLAWLGYDLEAGAVTSVPSFLAFGLEEGKSDPAALALGPDGLYFAPLIPGAGGDSPVLRLHYDPPNQHPLRVRMPGEGGGLFEAYGCRSCHLIQGSGGGVGPPLEGNSLRTRLESRLTSPAYQARVEVMSDMNQPPFAAWEEERQEILRLVDQDDIRAAMRLWVRSRIMEPKFDHPDAQMPDLGVPLEDADRMAAELVGGPSDTNLAERALDAVFGSRGRLAAFAAGVVAASALWALALRWQRRRGRP